MAKSPGPKNLYMGARGICILNSQAMESVEIKCEVGKFWTILNYFELPFREDLL